MKYKVEHQKRNSISSDHIVFCLLYKHTCTNNEDFDDFLKILQKFSESHRNVSDHFPKITKDHYFTHVQLRLFSGLEILVKHCRLLNNDFNHLNM